MEDIKYNKEIPIVFATNTKYIPYLAVAIQSISESASPLNLYLIYILHDSLSKENIEKVKYLSKKNIIIQDIAINELLSNIEVELHSHWHYSKEMYFRFLIAQLFKQYEKVIYLDCDLVVETDIAELFEIELGKNLVGAVWNISRPDFEIRLKRDLNITRDEYFNSGVLLINILEWNVRDIGKQCFDLLGKISKDKLQCPDQDILNLVCKNEVLYLDASWNFQWNQVYGNKECREYFKDKYSITLKNLKIMHFASNIKPWNSPELPLSYHFWKYARNTYFYEEILWKNQKNDKVQNNTTENKNNVNNKENEKLKRKSKMTYILKKIKGGIKCYKEHGFLYTWKRMLEHVGIPMEIELFKNNGKTDSVQQKQLEKIPQKVSKDYNYYANLAPENYVKELQEWFYTKTDKKLNLTKPNTFNEKIQWLKLYDSTIEKANLTDKYLVRRWIENVLGKKYLVPLLGVWDKFEDIDFEQLPEQFVLKATHGSGWNFIVKDKKTFNQEEAQKKFSIWMKKCFAYNAGLELHYKYIKPKIIAEKYIENHNDLLDYKFLCFNGEPKYVWVNTEREHGVKKDIFDLNWNLQPFNITYKNADIMPQKPKLFNEMLEIVKKLCKGFAHVRVDLYEVDGKIYFGEMTFTSESGIGKFMPEIYDLKLGEMLKLPIGSLGLTERPDLSIIIPVYNAAEYLIQCLESVINQNYGNFEVICINDASIDSSKKILQNFSEKDRRIKIIDYDVNKTASQARKDGVNAAQGKYIMFVDSDDILERNAVAELIRIMNDYQVDILQFGTYVEAEKNVREEAIQFFEKFVKPYLGRLEGKNVFESCFEKRLYRFSLWNKIYKTELCKKAFSYIENGAYPKAQDLYAFFIISWFAESYYGIENEFYHYHYGRGVTGGGKKLDLKELERHCTQAKVACKCKEFLDMQGVFARYEVMWKQINRDLLNECINNWYKYVDDVFGAMGFDIIGMYWSLEDIKDTINKNFKGSREQLSLKSDGAKILNGKKLIDVL